MSTSVILFDQNSNANYVDIMVFEPCVSYFPPAAVWGEIDGMVRKEKSFGITVSSTEISIESSVTTNQIAVFYNSNCNRNSSLIVAGN